MRIVTGFQYFPENKRETAHIIILDSEGDIWIRYNPLDDSSRWRKVILPYDFFEDDDA